MRAISRDMNDHDAKLSIRHLDRPSGFFDAASHERNKFKRARGNSREGNRSRTHNRSNGTAEPMPRCDGDSGTRMEPRSSGFAQLMTQCLDTYRTHIVQTSHSRRRARSHPVCVTARQITTNHRSQFIPPADPIQPGLWP